MNRLLTKDFLAGLLFVAFGAAFIRSHGPAAAMCDEKRRVHLLLKLGVD